MPVVLVGLAAVGVALLLLLVAYALTVLVAPFLEAMAHEVPVVGGYIGRAARKVIDRAGNAIIGYANTGLGMLWRWFSGLADAYTSFVDAVNAFIVELPGRLDHLTHVTVHEIVKAFVNPVRDLANDAKLAATDALSKVEAFVDAPLAHFKGIEHGVDDRLGHLRDLIENVDLPDLHDAIERQIHGVESALTGRVNDVTTYADQEFAQLWDQLHKIPLTRLLDGLAASTATAALLSVIASEAGLNRAECRGKVKQICATDPAAWEALLSIAGVALLWGGIEEFVQLTREFARETVPQIMELTRGH